VYSTCACLPSVLTSFLKEVISKLILSITAVIVPWIVQRPAHAYTDYPHPSGCCARRSTRVEQSSSAGCPPMTTRRTASGSRRATCHRLRSTTRRNQVQRVSWRHHHLKVTKVRPPPQKRWTKRKTKLRSPRQRLERRAMTTTTGRNQFTTKCPSGMGIFARWRA